jgi:CubicO group peptidase (beta-lactamase class C family)
MACAKHFPGHGDTNVDSHYDMPLIPHDRWRLDSVELYPFRVMVEQGIGSFMVAHLNVPALDAREKRPTTLSRPVITELLRKELGFDGLIFTDAMEMKGVTKYYGPGQADLEALRAGNDMVLLPENLEAGINAVKKGLAEGSLSAVETEGSVRRILHQKYRLGLTRLQQVEMKNLRRELNTPQAYLLKRRLIEKCLTLVRDNKNIVGCPDLENRRYATLALGDSNLTLFQKSCGFYTGMRHFNLGKVFTPERELQIIDSVQQVDVLLVSLHNMRSKASDNFGLTEQQINFVRRLCDVTTVGLTIFGNPYSLHYFDDIPTVLEAYTEDPFVQEIAAQAWFGARDITGKLPVTASKSAKYGQGLQKKWPQPRLRYDLPESVGMSSDTLRQIDSLMQVLINTGAAPGAQLCVVKDNCVVWHKAYGHHTYDQTRPVGLQDLYDVASVTKVAATTVSVMQLQDAGKIHPDSAMCLYVPELKNSNKKDLKVREIMAHHAALQAWIPFYQQTLSPQKTPLPNIYHALPSAEFSVPVMPNMMMNRAWKDTIWQQIFRSELRPVKTYKYSDLGLYLCARAIQNVSAEPVNDYALRHFYRPLGMHNTLFNPALCGIQYQCVPSEEDDYFRFGRVQGYVHDMGAAMLGGVSGHAGLFSTSNDLAKLFQMLLNKGSYFGKTYLKEATVREYTTRFAGSSRRGTGFDLKETNEKETLNMGQLAGPNTFGHLGFTGTCVWADPDQRLIFVFLSNRTYPTMNNNKLSNGNYRPRLQDIVYRSLQTAKPAN